MQLATKKADNPLADIEAESNTLRGLVIIGRLIERLEEVWNVFFGNSFARICHLEPDLIVETLDAKRYLAAMGELYSVADEIIENLPEPDRVGPNPVWDRSVERVSKTELFLTGAELELVHEGSK